MLECTITTGKVGGIMGVEKEQRAERIEGIIENVRRNQVETSEFATIRKDDFAFLVQEARENVGRFRFRGIVAGVANKPADGGTMEIKVKAPLTPALAAASVGWLNTDILVLIDPEGGQLGLKGTSSGLTETPDDDEEDEDEEGDLFDQPEEEDADAIDDADGNPVDDLDEDGNPL